MKVYTGITLEIRTQHIPEETIRILANTTEQRLSITSGDAAIQVTGDEITQLIDGLRMVKLMLNL